MIQVQATDISGAGTSGTLNWQVPTTAGNLLVVIVRSAIGGSAPAGWRSAVSNPHIGNACIDIFYQSQAPSQPYSRFWSGDCAIAMEFTIGNGNPLDKTAIDFATNNSAMDTGATSSTSTAVELVVAALAAQSYSPSGFTSGYTEVSRFENLSALVLVTSSAGAQECSATNGNITDWGGAIATFMH